MLTITPEHVLLIAQLLLMEHTEIPSWECVCLYAQVYSFPTYPQVIVLEFVLGTLIFMDNWRTRLVWLNATQLYKFMQRTKPELVLRLVLPQLMLTILPRDVLLYVQFHKNTMAILQLISASSYVPHSLHYTLIMSLKPVCTFVLLTRMAHPWQEYVRQHWIVHWIISQILSQNFVLLTVLTLNKLTQRIQPKNVLQIVQWAVLLITQHTSV